MISIAELRAGEGIMKYKSVYKLDQERRELDVWFQKEWGSLDRVADLAKAMLGGGAHSPRRRTGVSKRRQELMQQA